jgi:hypothetical protein
LISKFLEEQIASLSCEPNKKQTHVTPNANSSFFSSTNYFKTFNENKINFLVDVMLFMIKGYFPMKTV